VLGVDVVGEVDVAEVAGVLAAGVVVVGIIPETMAKKRF